MNTMDCIMVRGQVVGRDKVRLFHYCMQAQTRLSHYCFKLCILDPTLLFVKCVMAREVVWLFGTVVEFILAQ